MALAIIGFVFLAGVLIFYLLNTSSGSNNNNDPSNDHSDNDNIDDREEKDNTIVFPSDVEKAKKKRNIGK